MKKIKGRIISLLTVATLIATGTVPHAFSEAGKRAVILKPLRTILFQSKIQMKNRRISQAK